MNAIEWLDWPAPTAVKACYTTRVNGVSQAPYASFNVGDHVGDYPAAVVSNRQQLSTLIQQKNITWLQQVHGTRVVVLDGAAINSEADGATTCLTHRPCCVMTADCLPVFFCDTRGMQVAVAHAGWRGLLGGVLQQAIATFSSDASLMAYLGPAIGVKAFEVGEEVRQLFLALSPQLDGYFMVSHSPQKWMADLYGIARWILAESGVAAVYGGDRCTFTEDDLFFSYRRDGVTGRMANLIWLE